MLTPQSHLFFSKLRIYANRVNQFVLGSLLSSFLLQLASAVPLNFLAFVGESERLKVLHSSIKLDKSVDFPSKPCHCNSRLMEGQAVRVQDKSTGISISHLVSW